MEGRAAYSRRPRSPSGSMGYIGLGDFPCSYPDVVCRPTLYDLAAPAALLAKTFCRYRASKSWERKSAKGLAL